MATQYSALEVRAFWDAMVVAYAASRGGSEDDVMDSGVDMRSVDTLGPWDLVDATTFESYDPNNRMSVTFTNGTALLTFTPDELSNYGATGCFAKLDSFFGAHFKVYQILLKVKAAVEDAAIGATLTMPVPAALWGKADYQTLISGLAGGDGVLEISGLPSGAVPSGVGIISSFPAEPD